MKAKIKTPECDKIVAVHAKSQPQGEFLEWLEAKGYIERNTHKSIERLLAEFYGIDLNKVEREKRAILKSLQQS